MPSVDEQLGALRDQGHDVRVAQPGVHGASMLDPGRVENAGETWQMLEEWLAGVVPGAG